MSSSDGGLPWGPPTWPIWPIIKIIADGITIFTACSSGSTPNPSSTTLEAENDGHQRIKLTIIGGSASIVRQLHEGGGVRKGWDESNR